MQDYVGYLASLLVLCTFCARTLIVDRCVIYGFTVNGIDIATGAAGSVTVKDTLINHITNHGIRVGPGPALAADHVTISRTNGNGIEQAAPGTGTVSNSLIFGT